MERDGIRELLGELDDLLDKTTPKRRSGRGETPKRPEESNPETAVTKADEPEKTRSSKVEEPLLEEEADHKTSRSDDPSPAKGRSRKGADPLRFIRPSDGLLMAFLVPVVVMLIIFVQRGIFPFGEESFLRTDMYHQYAPFFSEFRHKLTQGGSLLYSWNVGMGVNFAALYAYYLASPLNWLLVLCPKGLIIEFMTYSIVLKIGLSGLSFAWYLRRHFGTRNFGVAFFGVFYALSGYMAAYSWNIMWLDCILLFPLILLGLERLVKEKKCLFYSIALGLSIISNYYISIMICIFLVIYYAALQILEERKPVLRYLADSARFAVFSLAAGGLSAVVLLPEIYALQSTASGDFSFPKTWESYFPIFDMIARHIGNVQTETGLDNWPNLYCGVAVLLLFLLFLGCRRISLKEKAVYCGLLLFFFASFSINVFNFIWHGFHYPNSLPCRQSFIYVALMLLVCYRVYLNLHEIPWKQVAAAFWGSAVFVLLAEKLVTAKHFQFPVYYAAVLFLILYAGLIRLYQRGRMNYNLLVLLALGVVSVEAAVNTAVTSVPVNSRTSYVKDNAAVIELLDDYADDSSFYRVEKTNYKTRNDGAWMNFPSVSLFSSTANADLTNLFGQLGCESSTNAYGINGSTPLVDALFAQRYALYQTPPEDSTLRTLLGSRGDTYLYENTYVLPLGFLVPNSLDYDWPRDLGNPAQVQNSLCDVLGVEQVLVPEEGQTDGYTYTFTPSVPGEYYVYVTNKEVEDVTASHGENSKFYANVDRGYFLELGYCEAGETVTLTSKDRTLDLTAEAYRFSEGGLAEICRLLGGTPLTISRWEDSYLEGTVNADRNGLMWTSIPFDKGWTVKVDGAKKDVLKVVDAFLAFYVPPGEHTVTLSYTPPGLKLGAEISVVSLLFIGFAAVYVRLNKRKKSKNMDKGGIQI